MTRAAGWGLPEPAPEPWASGRWALRRCGDELADLAFDGRPVLRSIRAVVRDRDWRTVPPTVEVSARTPTELRLRLRFAGLGADLAGELTAVADGDRLRVDLALTSASGFDRNRIGLVVLHGAEVAGTALTVGHVNGTVTRTRFPRRIAPHQPAFDIRSLEWEGGGVRTALVFDGDSFEMEDQRNWTDASFKTYSTPLRRVFPVRIRPGDEIRQSVELTCAVTGEAPVAGGADAPVALVPRGGPLPEFALGATTAPGPVDRADSATVLVELDAEDPAWPSALARAAAEADALDVRIVAERAEAVRAVVAALARAGAPRVVRAGVFARSMHGTEPELWHALRDGAVEAGLTAELVGGTRAHFTELNRHHAELPDDLPALAFSSTPQMHAVEARQLVESIGIQRRTAEDAVRLAAGRPVHIGPVTLRSRFNAVATTPQGAASVAGYAAVDADATDPRQNAPALAAWTVASAAAFSVPGVAGVTWFEAAGPRGVRGPDADPPVRAAVLDVLALSGRPALDAVAPPPGTHVLAAATAEGVVALVANLGEAPIEPTLVVGGDPRSVVVPPLEYRRLDWPAATAAAATAAR